MAKFLIDANLPYYFNLWNNTDYIHLKDIDDTLSDEKVWEYAKTNNLIIITKDSDFSVKVLFKGSPPKVIHIKFGNVRMKEFYELIFKVWDEVVTNVEKYSLINIYSDKIEYIN